MAARFGETHVFVDVDLEPGVDFVERIKEAIAACHVLLVIIGPRWAVISDDDGEAADRRPRGLRPARGRDRPAARRRHRDPGARRRRADARPRRPAREPAPARAPQRARAQRHALALRRRAAERAPWTSCSRYAPPTDPRGARTGPQPSPPGRSPTGRPSASAARCSVDRPAVHRRHARRRRWRRWSPAGSPTRSTPPSSRPEAGQIAAAILRRTLTWAVLGVALAAWLSFVRGECEPLAGRALLGLVVGALAGALGGVISRPASSTCASRAPTETVRAISIAASPSAAR